MDYLLSLNWQPRVSPLPAGAVAARGLAARELARRVLARPDDALTQLTGAAGAGYLVLLGEMDALPWADGAVYLAHESMTPALWLPTTLTTVTPLALLERALRARFPALEPPFAVLPQWNLVLPVGAAQSLSRRQLEEFLREDSLQDK